MDTSSSATKKKTIRASLTEQYEERVATTLEKVDPNRAKARAILKDEEEMEHESLDGEWDGYKEALPNDTQPYLETPLLTLRQLMPGSSGGDEEDQDLDQSFRADKIEFMVVRRPLTPDEARAETVLVDPGDVDWTIPEQADYELSLIHI